MNKPALLLSLLALGALGLVACGEGDDDQTTRASETETSNDSAAVKAERQLARARFAADNTADNKPCGRVDRWRFAVVEGDVSCRVARRVMRANFIPTEMPGSWSCGGPDSGGSCVNGAGDTIKGWVTCGAWRASSTGSSNRRCPGWIKRSEAQRRHGRESDASAATTTAPDRTKTAVAPTPKKYASPMVPKGTGRKAIRSGSASAYTPKVSKAHNRVDLFTPFAERVFCRGRESECAASEPATAEAGDLTIVWENGGDPSHNICMEDEQGKPVFKKVVFNGGRERSAQATPRCSEKIRARTLRARAKVKPGEYTYYCSVGRHREAGMEGTLTVK